MNKILYITLIESIYIYFMYNLFKTKISFHNPIEIYIQNKNISHFLKHPVYNGSYESKICPFGKFVSIVLIIWLYVRLYFKKEEIIKINYLIFILIFIGSFMMNLNSFIYFLPIYIYEFILYPKLKID
tara:strand:- start:398 stop:781 length:384 start_codon:yes stop_codon:yes gene_type:complete